MLKKIAFWAVIIFVSFYVITDPHALLGLLQNAGNSLASFIHSL